MRPAAVAVLWLLTVVACSLIGQGCYDHLHPPTTVGDPTQVPPLTYQTAHDAGTDAR